jgi:hypothetical protein
MLLLLKKTSKLLASCTTGCLMLVVPVTMHAAPQASPPALSPKNSGPMEAQYRGCSAAGWCTFWIKSLDPWAQSLYRVRPDGVVQAAGNDGLAVAVRDRLNALLADMIHQAKYVELHDLRALDDGTFAATVTVTGVPLASDPVLVQLRGKAAGATR